MSHILRVRRESCGATLKQVAEIVGTSDVQIHRWELRKSQPSPENLGKWTQAVTRLEAVVRRRVAEARGE